MGYLDIVELLIEKNANISIKDNDGLNAYDHAISNGKMEVHTSQIGDLVQSNFLSNNDNTIDLDYPCALQNTPVLSL